MLDPVRFTGYLDCPYVKLMCGFILGVAEKLNMFWTWFAVD